ncbi:hypothetical protein [Marine gokushovirus]|nr:hypothetical protein [Marine gokushovirus]
MREASPFPGRALTSTFQFKYLATNVLVADSKNHDNGLFVVRMRPNSIKITHLLLSPTIRITCRLLIILFQLLI